MPSLSVADVGISLAHSTGTIIFREVPNMSLQDLCDAENFSEPQMRRLK